jgi:hypothetical protein
MKDWRVYEELWEEIKKVIHKLHPIMQVAISRALVYVVRGGNGWQY